MKKEIEFTAKQVGERVKERRTELNLTMPELGKRIGVNKSTIQRYEADGVDPKRTMIINGLADALLTTPEWLTGLSEEKEYDWRHGVRASPAPLPPLRRHLPPGEGRVYKSPKICYNTETNSYKRSLP